MIKLSFPIPRSTLYGLQCDVTRLLPALQNKVQSCCRPTLYQWFLHVVEVGGLYMPTNGCSKAGELLATGQLQFPQPLSHTPSPYKDKQTVLAVVLLCPTSNSLSFCKSHRCRGQSLHIMGLHVQPSIAPIYISLTLGLSAILPKHGCHFKQLLISAKVLNILIYCYYLLVKRSSMHLLSKFELKIPPS